MRCSHSIINISGLSCHIQRRWWALSRRVWRSLPTHLTRSSRPLPIVTPVACMLGCSFIPSMCVFSRGRWASSPPWLMPAYCTLHFPAINWSHVVRASNPGCGCLPRHPRSHQCQRLWPLPTGTSMSKGGQMMNRRTVFSSLDALESTHSERLLSGCWFAAACGMAIFQMLLLAQAWHEDPHALRTACIASAWVIGSVLGLRLQFALLRHSSPVAFLWGSGYLGCALLWVLGIAP